jgi:hypothetical protein
MRLIILTLLVLLSSCHHNKKDLNSIIIPEDKFINLLVDYHLAVSVSYSDYYRQKTKNINQMNINDTVLKSYGYTKANFDSSVSFYSGNPEKFDAIYDKVIARLSRMQAEIQQKIAKRAAEDQKKEAKKLVEQKKIAENLRKQTADKLNIQIIEHHRHFTMHTTLPSQK